MDSIAHYSTDDRIIAQAMRIIEGRFQCDATALTSPAMTYDYLKLRVACSPHELFGMVFMDNRNRVIAIDELFRGTIDGASVYPREVVKAALQHNAAAVILYHNHPSGISEPSQADIRITERIKKALALVDIRVLDHVIIGGASHTCLSEQGLL